MTALTQFDRLEATGLWRPNAGAQRREVVVSLGDATLTITDTNDRVLTHWSIAAVTRENPGEIPALYHPDGDPGEVLELPASESEMIGGIDRLLQAIDRRRPHPGKLRLILGLALVAAILAAAVFWLPNALERYAVNVVPAVKRTEIGQQLLGHVARVTGQPCRARDARQPLDRMAQRLLGPDAAGRLVVVPGGMAETTHLPGGIILLNRAIVEDHEDPDVMAGFVLAEDLRASLRDPLADLLDHAGLLASLRLLTSGALPDASLVSYAQDLLKRPKPLLPPEALLARFDKAQLRSTPYAYARDITGETTLPLIEADPMAGRDTPPVLRDGDWVRLQGICGA